LPVIRAELYFWSFDQCLDEWLGHRPAAHLGRAELLEKTAELIAIHRVRRCGFRFVLATTIPQDKLKPNAIVFRISL